MYCQTESDAEVYPAKLILGEVSVVLVNVPGLALWASELAMKNWELSLLWKVTFQKALE